MELGLIVLSLVIIFNVIFMVFVMRMILTEPPHKEPTMHPWVLEYATNTGDTNTVEEAVEAEEDSTETSSTEEQEPPA